MIHQFSIHSSIATNKTLIDRKSKKVGDFFLLISKRKNPIISVTRLGCVLKLIMKNKKKKQL